MKDLEKTLFTARRVVQIGVLLGACVVAGTSSADAHAAPTEEVSTALDPLAVALKRDTGVDWYITRRASGRVMMALPTTKARPFSKTTNPGAVAREFFYRYATLLGCPVADAPRVTDIADGFGGQRVVSLAQSVGSLPIINSGSSITVAPDGSIALAELDCHPNLKAVPTSPAFGPGEAKTRALAAAPRAEVESIRLVVYVDDTDALRLVYEMRLRKSEIGYMVMDALSGKVLDTRGHYTDCYDT